MWNKFEKYAGFNPIVDVYSVVQTKMPTIHRFFDTSPISPSGRYIGLTEFPYEDHLPSPGDKAVVVVIDLETGIEVYRSETAAWGTQVGAQVQWGIGDHELFFNRMDEKNWEPYGVCVDIFSNNEKRFKGTIYVVSSNGRYALSPCLKRIETVQAGYGVTIPDKTIPRNAGAPSNDGIYLTDCHSGTTTLFLSINKIFETLKPKFSKVNLSEGAFYSFHVKWNSQDTRIMFILRWLPNDSKRKKTFNYLITCKSDGSDICMAIDANQWSGGHHPNWCPDGHRIIMNLVFSRKVSLYSKITIFTEKIAKRLGIRYYSSVNQIKFGIFQHDGNNLKIVAPSHYGSGHPSMHPDGIHIITDCYPYERVAFSDGTVPLRWIDSTTDESLCVVRIPTTPIFNGPHKEYRIDPHPVWDKSGRWLIFNACREGIRTVYIADFKNFIQNHAHSIKKQTVA